MNFQGLASRTETPYDMGWYVETIARGAFKKSLAENPDVVLNIQHGEAGSGLPIARTKAGNMTLTEDHEGLKVDAELDPLDPDVQLVARKMGNGNLDGQMSFAFSIPEGRQKWSQDYTERRILEADIHRGDVSIVVQGANPTTISTLRNFRAALAAAGRRSTLANRRELAETLGSAVIVEMRSFVLDGRSYDFDGDIGTRPGPVTKVAAVGGGHVWLPVFDASAERARLEALRYPQKPAA
jgi:HK97 family phage prohead protease